MQTGSIIEKANKLGLDIGDGSTSLDNLRAIASQVGLHDINSLDDAGKLESVLDQKLGEAQVAEPGDILGDENNNTPIRNERFGQRQYDQAKKDGVYDANHYKARQQELDKKAEGLNNERHNKSKLKKGETGPIKADGSNTVRKSKMDRVMDNLNYAKAKKDAISNKIDGAKASAYNAMHPVEHAKDVAKSQAKKAVNDVKNKAKTKTKALAKSAGKKIVAFIAANPCILLLLAGVILIIIIILSFVSTDDTNGYYSQECNFNASTVVLNTCNAVDTTSISLEDYVIGTTYSLVNGNTYSDDVIKAIMIVVKTNALSYGNYNSAMKILSLDDCIYSYASEVPDSVKKSYNSLYNSISNYLYISSSYSSAISNMSLSSALNINEEVINEMASLDLGYEEILKSVYTGDSDVVGEYRDSLFIGDSRLKGMVYAGAVNESNAIYGVGYGYNWLIGDGVFDSSYTNSVNGGINGINNKIIEGKNYNIITWLGVNDFTYNDANTYFNKYYELATGEWSNHTIYVVNVGPVSDASDISNDSINMFNNTMKSLIAQSGLDNLKYINVNYSITSYDDAGVHYGSNDYKNIYSVIQSNLDNSLNGDYILYDLGEHCTYYTLTDNEAYWWPIGSKETTTGNIYGGVPTSTTITSYFGPRTVQGVAGNHGAIDIGAACNTNVVIATKDGVVKSVNNTCDNNGYYKNTCGGGLGNYVVITHSDGTEARYGHMYPDSITVSVGDNVAQGQKIGMVGNSGSSTGCHLHFEMRVNNAKVDPLKYVDPDSPRPTINTNINIVAGTDEGGQQNVCRALLASGFSNNAIAGIMVNMAAESSFRTNAVEYASGHTIDDIFEVSADEAAGFGLVQWSFGRRINMINYANSKGLSPTSLQAQLEYFNQEIQNSYPVTKKYIFGNYSAYDIGLTFCKDFERPQDLETTCPARVSANIDKYIEYVNNGCN